MKVIILSKKKFKEFMTYNDVNDENVENKDMLIISINDFYNPDMLHNDKHGVNSHFRRQHPNVLIEHFGDYPEDFIERNSKYSTTGFFTPFKAHKMYEFIKRNSDKNLAIVHCAAGISRSGAVGSFVYDMYGKEPYEQFFRRNKQIEPNTHVSRLLHLEMYKDK